MMSTSNCPHCGKTVWIGLQKCPWCQRYLYSSPETELHSSEFQQKWDTLTENTLRSEREAIIAERSWRWKLHLAFGIPAVLLLVAAVAMGETQSELSAILHVPGLVLYTIAFVQLAWFQGHSGWWALLAWICMPASYLLPDANRQRLAEIEDQIAAVVAKGVPPKKKRPHAPDKALSEKQGLLDRQRAAPKKRALLFGGLGILGIVLGLPFYGGGMGLLAERPANVVGAVFCLLPAGILISGGVVLFVWGVVNALKYQRLSTRLLKIDDELLAPTSLNEERKNLQSANNKLNNRGLAFGGAGICCMLLGLPLLGSAIFGSVATPLTVRTLVGLGVGLLAGGSLTGAGLTLFFFGVVNTVESQRRAKRLREIGHQLLENAPATRNGTARQLTPEGDQNAEVVGHKACPSCRGKLRADAVVCIACGFDLRSGKELPRPSSRRPASQPIQTAGGCARIVSFLAVGFILYILVICMIPPFQAARDAPGEAQCTDNLKQIGEALRQYREQYDCLPPASMTDQNGRPSVSWRVVILPFLGEKPLFERYDLREPWDGPENRKLNKMMPSAYRCPSDRAAAASETSYVTLVGDGTIAGPPSRAIRVPEDDDRWSEMIIIAEVAESGIPWTEPRDLSVKEIKFAINQPSGEGIRSSHFRSGANVLLYDGSPRFFSESIGSATLRGSVVRNDLTLSALTKAAVGENTEEAAKAVANLGMISDPAAVPALIQALRHGDDQVRNEAEIALARVGSGGGNAVPALIELLEDPDPVVRRASAQALGNIGPGARAAVGQLAAALADLNTLMPAADALASIGEPAAPAVPALLEALAAADRDVRSRDAMRDSVYQALEKTGGMEYIDLCKRLMDGQTPARAAAAREAGKLGAQGKAFLPLLIRALADTKEEVSSAAAASLADIGRQLRPDLVKSLWQKDERARRRAVITLAVIGTDAADTAAALLALQHELECQSALVPGAHLEETRSELPSIASPNDRTQLSMDVPLARLVSLALEKIGPVPSSDLLSVLRDFDSPFRAGAAFGLGRLAPESPQAIADLTLALNSPHAALRKAAAWALGRFGPAAKPAVAALSRNANDEDRLVRITAAWALHQIGAVDKDAMPGLMSILGDDDNTARLIAAGVLVTMGPEAEVAADRLALVLGQQEDPSVRLQLASKVAHVMPAAPVPALIELLQDKDQEIRREAAATLAKVAPAAKVQPGLLMKALQDETDPRIYGELYLYALRNLNRDPEQTRHWIPRITALATRSDDQELRFAAQTVLRELGPISVREIEKSIENELDNPSFLNSTQGAETIALLGWFGESAKAMVPRLIAILQRSYYSPKGEHGAAQGTRTKLALALIDTLGKLDPVQAREVLFASAIQGDPPAIAAAAQDALAAAGPGAVPLLVRHLESFDSPTRSTAVEILAKIGVDAHGAFPQMVEIVEDGKEQQALRLAAMRAMGAIRPGESVPYYVGFLELPDDWSGRLQRHEWTDAYLCESLRCLSGLGPAAKDAVPRIANLAGIDNDRMRTLAIETLAQLGPHAKGAVPSLEECVRSSTNPAIRERARSALRRISPETLTDQAQPREQEPLEFVPRLWRDMTGRFSIEARFRTKTPDKVTLETRDGREVTVDIRRLSRQDQDWLKKNVRE